MILLEVVNFLMSGYLYRKAELHLFLTHILSVYSSLVIIKMPSTSVLETFWPVIRVLQIMGLFPIKKSSETLCGFEEMPTGEYLILTLAIQLAAQFELDTLLLFSLVCTDH